MAVAGEETLQPQHVGIVGAADDHRPAGAGLQQADAAQDQRAHDALAELGLLHQQVAQPIGRTTTLSTGASATASTSAGRAESCASSPTNCPGSWGQ